MAKRKNGEGSWGTKTIKGTTYKYFRDSNGKYFYGKTEKEINIKRKAYENSVQTTTGSSVLFIDYIDNYIHTKIDVESTTLDGYEDVIKGMLKPHPIANCEIQNLNEDNMRDYINNLAKKYARSSIQKLVAVIRPALKYAVKHGDITIYPLEDVKIPSEDKVAVKKKEVPYIIESDLNKLYIESKRINQKGITWSGQYGKPTYGVNADIIVFIGHTGLRISEAIGLRWEHVDLENKYIYIREAVVKTKDRSDSNKKYTNKRKGTKSSAGERDIPLSNIAIEMLEKFSQRNPKHKPQDPVILTEIGTSPTPSNIRRILDSMLIRSECSIKHCGLHGLRHGFGAILLNRGVDIKKVSMLLGHKDITTTYNIYISFTKEQISQSVISVLDNIQ